MVWAVPFSYNLQSVTNENEIDWFFFLFYFKRVYVFKKKKKRVQKRGRVPKYNNKP